MVSSCPSSLKQSWKLLLSLPLLQPLHLPQDHFESKHLPRSSWKLSAIIKFWLTNPRFPTSPYPQVSSHTPPALRASILVSPQLPWSPCGAQPAFKGQRKLDFPSRNQKPKSRAFVKSFQTDSTLELQVIPILPNQRAFNQFLYMNPLSPPIPIINLKTDVKWCEMSSRSYTPETNWTLAVNWN